MNTLDFNTNFYEKVGKYEILLKDKKPSAKVGSLNMHYLNQETPKIHLKLSKLLSETKPSWKKE